MIAFLKARVSFWLERFVFLLLPFIVFSSLRRNMHAVWLKADWSKLPSEGFIFAVNHHSWWDVYLVIFLRKLLGRPVSAIMDDEQLATYSFFRLMGAVGRKELREALRRIKRGDMFFVFPEGELRQAGRVESVEKGVAFLARVSGARVFPLVFRVVMRGAQRPEVLIGLGDELEDASDLEALQASLNALLETVDATLAASNPEEVPVGFENVLSGKQSMNQQTRWLRKLRS